MDEVRPLVSTLPLRLLILPHRSLSRAGLWCFLAAQSLAAGGFAGLAAWYGNLLAPPFAALELAVVAYCLHRVWRRSAVGETISLYPEALEVTRMDEAAEPQRFHPYWVRIELRSARRFGWPSRLVLRSHGREVEIGAFLNDAERRQLARRLTDLLLQARAGASIAASDEHERRT
jgi:uncharacterized membrane protein